MKLLWLKVSKDAVLVWDNPLASVAFTTRVKMSLADTGKLTLQFVLLPLKVDNAETLIPFNDMPILFVAIVLVKELTVKVKLLVLTNTFPPAVSGGFTNFIAGGNPKAGNGANMK